MEGEVVLYPLNLELGGKCCAVVGGGRVAERKILTLLQTGAKVTVIAPQLTEKLAELAKEQKICWQQQNYASGCLQAIQPLLVFIATDDAKVNEQAAQEAKALHALANVATSKKQSDFTVPSSVRRGDLLLTVSTNGGSPALSRALREQLELVYPAQFADFLQALEKLREEAKKTGDSLSRQQFWRRALSPHVMKLVRAGRLQEAEGEVRHAFINLRAES